MTDLSGSPIEGTSYSHGDEVQDFPRFLCPRSCEIPQDCSLVQVVTPGTPFSVRCPNDCGLAIRVVPVRAVTG